MDVKKNGWKKIFGQADDLKEWVQFLEKEARDDTQPIWGDLNTADVINLIEELLQDFKGCLKTARGKIDQFEKEAFQKIRIETQEFLDSFSFRKERQI